MIGEYLAAMERGDRAAAVAFYADDVVMHVPGRSAFAGARRGRAAVMAYLAAALERADGGAEVELVDMLASEERVMLLVRERFSGGIEIERANVYTVRGEEIVEAWIYEADQYAVDDLLGRA